MDATALFTTLIILVIFGFLLGKFKATKLQKLATKPSDMHSTPGYYASMVAIWCGIPALLLMGGWILFSDFFITQVLIANFPEAIQALPKDELGLVFNNINLLASTSDLTHSTAEPYLVSAAVDMQQLQLNSESYRNTVVLIMALAGLIFGVSKVMSHFPARVWVERVTIAVLMLSSLVAILTTVGIIFSMLFESIRFFGEIPFTDFMFGTHWSPQTAIREDQVSSSGSFGAIPLFLGTLMISVIAMLIAVPIGLLSAIYMSEYANPTFRSFAKPLLEILAGIPTVVYGFFAALTLAPFIRDIGDYLGLSIASESALAVGLVMGIMIIPFISSLSDDVINAVPKALREASYGLGVTQSETIWHVVLPAALPGIIGSILLAFSRAIGETMIVVMAAGLAANLTANPLEAVTTVTVQMVTLLTGDQEFDSAKTLAAFALGMMLFVTTLLLNVFALHIVRKYREEYD